MLVLESGGKQPLNANDVTMVVAVRNPGMGLSGLIPRRGA